MFKIYHVLTLDPALLDTLKALTFDSEQRITALEMSMSVLSDKIAEVKKSFNDAVARNQADDAARDAAREDFRYSFAGERRLKGFDSRVKLHRVRLPDST